MALTTAWRKLTRTAASVASVAVLVAVPALAFASLGAGLFSPPGAEDPAVREFATGGVLAFDAPASKVIERRVAEGQAGSGPAGSLERRDETVTLLADWHYTAARSRLDPIIVFLIYDLLHDFRHHHHHHHHPSPHD